MPAACCWPACGRCGRRSTNPGGERLQPADAPALFEALERIRKKIDGPPIHRVYLDGEFNASIRQQPRWGLFGGSINTLTVGLPMLMAIDKPRFLAVLAHEYGHLRGDHGRFGAWIYRTRLSWAKLNHSLGDDGVAAVATPAFFRWYFPRFLAKTFALARQDEYEADRISGRLMGRDVAGAALIEIEVRNAVLQREFWPAHWGTAGPRAAPLGPYGAMARFLALAPEPGFARQALHDALKRISDVSDTHPGLRDRLEALDAGTALPAWSARSALALLGSGSARWLAHFDQAWCRQQADTWRQHHAYLGRVKSRADALSASIGRNNANEMVELADLQRRLDARANVRPHYERALQLTPQHAGALRGLIEAPGSADDKTRLDHLARLYEHSAPHRWWAARTAVEQLESTADATPDDKALKQWRERAKKAGEAEQRAWAELTTTPFFHSISRHDLSEFEAGELVSGLARCAPVARAWLVRKNLAEFAHRRCYLLFVELPGLDDDARYELCRALESSLELPGPVLVLWAGHSPTLEDIEHKAFDPVFVRGRS